MKLVRGVLLALSILCFAIYAQADLITTDPVADVTVLDFEAEPEVSSAAGPLQIGTPAGMDIEFSGSPNTDLYITTGWGLGANGSWSGIRFIGVNAARPGSMIIAFNDGPVAFAGGFINHAPDYQADLVITALDQSMGVLETHNITSEAPIITPGETNAGGFRGISRPTADIYYLEVYGYVPVMDYLTVSGTGLAPSVPVPTLSTATLFILALILLLVGLPLVHRRKHLLNR